MSAQLYRPSQMGIEKAAEDQSSGFDMLLEALGISDTFGSGGSESSDFFERSMGPIMTAIINAMASDTGAMPVDLSSVFGNIKQGLAPGGGAGGVNLYSYLRDLGQKGIAAALGGAGAGNYDSTVGALRAMSPLATKGMWAGDRNAFYTGQDQLVRRMNAGRLEDPSLGGNWTGPGGGGNGSWGEYIANDPFYNTYYGGKPRPGAAGAGNQGMGGQGAGGRR